MDLFPLWNSLRIAAISTVIVFFAGLFAAYYIARLPRLVKGVLDVVLTLPLVLPPTVIGYLLLRLLGQGLWEQGVTFGTQTYTDVYLELYDYTVEETELLIKMKAPLTVYATDSETRKTFYFGPDEPMFYDMINDNFYRKYQAYYGILPTLAIRLEVCGNKPPQKVVTNYKGTYITAWRGTYKLSGERKYLDFLYQTGLGAKNAQGFGMFEIL